MIRRCLVVTTWFPDDQNPARTPFCLEHAKAIRDIPSNVIIIHVKRGSDGAPTQTESYMGLHVIRVPLNVNSPLSALQALRTIRRYARGADVVHTMAFSSLFVTAPALLGMRKTWVHSEHWSGVMNPASVGRVWSALSPLRHALRLPRKVTVVSGVLGSNTEKFTRKGAVRVVPCVVHSAAVPKPFPALTPLRIVSVGNLVPTKNPLLAIETIAHLRALGHDASLTWIGDGPLRPDVERLVSDHDLNRHIHLIGRVPPQEVSTWLERAHLFFLPTSQETFLASAAEAISVGRPAVLPDAGGFVDYCTADNAVLVRGRGVEDFAQGILLARQKFANNEPERIAATLGNRFSPARISTLFAQVYREAGSVG